MKNLHSVCFLTAFGKSVGTICCVTKHQLNDLFKVVVGIVIVVAQVFLTADTVAKAQALLIILTMALLYSSEPVSHDTVTVSHQAQYQDAKTAIILLFTPVFFLL